MYKIPNYDRGTITSSKKKEGIPLEVKIEALIAGKENINEGVEMIYTDKSMGVVASYNIKSDPFEVAMDMKDRRDRLVAARKKALNMKKKEELSKEEMKKIDKKIDKNDIPSNDINSSKKGIEDSTIIGNENRTNN